MISFIQYSIKTKLQQWGRGQWLPGVRDGVGGGEGRWATRGAFVVKDCVHVSIRAVILNYSFAGCYHWEELGKGCLGFFCVVWIYNFIKIKSLIKEKHWVQWGQKFCSKFNRKINETVRVDRYLQVNIIFRNGPSKKENINLNALYFFNLIFYFYQSFKMVRLSHKT